MVLCLKSSRWLKRLHPHFDELARLVTPAFLQAIRCYDGFMPCSLRSMLGTGTNGAFSSPFGSQLFTRLVTLVAMLVVRVLVVAPERHVAFVNQMLCSSAGGRV